MKEKIRQLRHANPFRPFVVEMTDGRRFQINDPDFIFASPRENSWVIVAEEQGDRTHHLSPYLIREVELAPEAGLVA